MSTRPTSDIEYAGPTGREQPGEHWNARILRELRERDKLAAEVGAGPQATQMNELADIILGEPDADDVAEKAADLAELVKQYTAVAYP